MAAATNNLNKIIQSHAKQMHIFTDTIKTIVENCSTLNQKSIDQVNIVLTAFKPTIDIISDIIKNTTTAFADIDIKSIIRFTDILNAFKSVVVIVDEVKNVMSKKKFTTWHIWRFRRMLKKIMELMYYLIYSGGALNPALFFAAAQRYVIAIHGFLGVIASVSRIRTTQLMFLRYRLFLAKTMIRILYRSMRTIIRGALLTKKMLGAFGKGILLKPMLRFFAELKFVIQALKMINIKFMITARFKMWFVKRFIRRLLKTMTNIIGPSDMPLIVKLAISSLLLHMILNQFYQILVNIREFLTFRKIFWLTVMGKIYIRRLKKIIRYVNRIIRIMGTIKINIPGGIGALMLNIIKANIALFGIQLIMKLIRKINIPLFINSKIKKLVKSIRLLKTLIRQIAKFAQSVQRGMFGMSLIKIVWVFKKIKRLFKILSAIFLTIILISVVFVMAIPSCMIMLLGLLALRGVIWLVAKITKGMVSLAAEIIIKLSILMIILLILLAIGTVLTLWNIIGLRAVVGALKLALFNITLLLVIGSLIALGIVLGSFLIPLSPIILIGLITFGIIVFALLSIVVCLKLIEILSIDQKVIIKNIKTIFITARFIINSIFSNDIVETEDSQGKPWYKSVFERFGGLGDIITAIVAIAFLAVTFIAIFFISLIAFQLRAIQFWNLKEDKIKTNVDIVLRTASQIVDMVFAPYDSENKPSSKGFILDVLEFLMPSCSAIFTAIMAIAFLAVTIVAIVLITFLAAQLRLLQIIDLNSGIIKENVQLVIDTAQMVTSAIFDTPDNTENTSSNKGFFLSILEFFNKPFAAIYQAIMSIAFLALTIVAIILITVIAKQLKSIAQLDIASQKEAIEGNISAIIYLSKKVVESIFAPDETEAIKTDKKGLGAILKWVLDNPITNLIEALMSIGYLAIVVVAVGMLGKIARDLSDILKLPKTDGIEQKAEEITKASRVVIDAVFAGGVKGKELKDLIKRAESAEEYLNVLMKLPQKLQTLTNNLQSLTQIDSSILEKTKTSIIDLITDLLSPFDEKKNFNYNKVNGVVKLIYSITQLTKQSESEVEKTRSLLSNYDAFLTKINDIDLTKLQTTVKLFEQMAKFSRTINGNFEDLAEALNEKIAPLLEELKTSLTSVENRVNEKPNTDMEAEKLSIFNDFKQNGQTQNLTKSQIETKVDNKYKDDVQQRYGIDEILSKLSSLMDLFQNGEAKVRTT